MFLFCFVLFLSDSMTARGLPGIVSKTSTGSVTKFHCSTVPQVRFYFHIKEPLSCIDCRLTYIFDKKYCMFNYIILKRQ